MSNDTNPYQPSSTTSSIQAQPHDDEAYQIAKAQKLVLYALLSSILLNIFGIFLGGTEVTAILVLVGYVAVAAFSMYAIFALAKLTSSTGVGVFCAIMMIVPCISLLTLLIINQKATGFLTGRGYKVGLMGANLSQFNS
jgi:hypothetical protein